jgi:hypothetical protein
MGSVRPSIDVDNSLVAQALAFVKAHFFLAAFVAIVLRGLYKRYASPLKDIPGPFLASCSRLWKGRRDSS